MALLPTTNSIDMSRGGRCTYQQQNAVARRRQGLGQVRNVHLLLLDHVKRFDVAVAAFVVEDQEPARKDRGHGANRPYASAEYLMRRGERALLCSIARTSRASIGLADKRCNAAL